MTLLLTLFAAVISTFVWYRNAPKDIYRIRTLCFMFWGASLMWLVDAVVEYIEAGSSYFRPEPIEMLNDAFLGLSVIALAGVVWIVDLIIHDPRKVIKSTVVKLHTPETSGQSSRTDSPEVSV